MRKDPGTATRKSRALAVEVACGFAVDWTVLGSGAAVLVVVLGRIRRNVSPIESGGRRAGGGDVSCGCLRPAFRDGTGPWPHCRAGPVGNGQAHDLGHRPR